MKFEFKFYVLQSGKPELVLYLYPMINQIYKIDLYTIYIFYLHFVFLFIYFYHEIQMKIEMYNPIYIIRLMTKPRCWYAPRYIIQINQYIVVYYIYELVLRTVQSNLIKITANKTKSWVTHEEIMLTCVYNIGT